MLRREGKLTAAAASEAVAAARSAEGATAATSGGTILAGMESNRDQTHETTDSVSLTMA